MDIYELVNEKIIKALETGTAPWRKSWRSMGQQKNLVSGKAYQGLNQFMLAMEETTTPYWLSYKQALDLGGNVKSGSKGQRIVFWKLLDHEKDGKIQSVPLLRYSTVFNLDQCEGIKTPDSSAASPLVFTPIEKAENILSGYRVEMKHGGERAFYVPKFDTITMPPKESFSSTEAYYSTLFHEMTHSTGHESRLKREGITEVHHYGDAVYSKEELIAEFGAAFLCCKAGIESTLDNSASYIQGWLKILKANKTWLVNSASAAQKAVNYIIGEQVSA
jgi:antirestriction protein ArdC